MTSCKLLCFFEVCAAACGRGRFAGVDGSSSSVIAVRLRTTGAGAGVLREDPNKQDSRSLPQNDLSQMATEATDDDDDDDADRLW